MILGDQNCQIQDISSSEIIDLLYSNMDPDFIQPNEIEHQSVINGYRSYTKISNPHAEFVVTIHLFKYSNPGSMFWKIYQYLNKDVWFYPHKNNTLKIKCHIVDIKLFYLEQPWHYDACTITFRSVEPVQYIAETFTSVLVDKDDNYITDKDGNRIYIKKGPEIFREDPSNGGAYDI